MGCVFVFCFSFQVYVGNECGGDDERCGMGCSEVFGLGSMVWMGGATDGEMSENKCREHIVVGGWIE